jgi:hypothetical protein
VVRLAQAVRAQVALAVLAQVAIVLIVAVSVVHAQVARHQQDQAQQPVAHRVVQVVAVVQALALVVAVTQPELLVNRAVVHQRVVSQSAQSVKSSTT